MPEGWSQIRPDVIVAQGELDTLPAGWSVHRDPGSLVPTVTTDTNQTFNALATGYNDTPRSRSTTTAPIRSGSTTRS